MGRYRRLDDGILEIEIKIEGKREGGRKRHIVSVFHGVALPFVAAS